MITPKPYGEAGKPCVGGPQEVGRAWTSKVPKIMMAQCPKIEAISKVGSIIWGILGDQVGGLSCRLPRLLAQPALAGCCRGLCVFL